MQRISHAKYWSPYFTTDIRARNKNRIKRIISQINKSIAGWNSKQIQKSLLRRLYSHQIMNKGVMILIVNYQIFIHLFRLFHLTNDRFIDRLIDWFIDWLIDLLIYWLIYRIENSIGQINKSITRWKLKKIWCKWVLMLQRLSRAVSLTFGSKRRYSIANCSRVDELHLREADYGRGDQNGGDTLMAQSPVSSSATDRKDSIFSAFRNGNACQRFLKLCFGVHPYRPYFDKHSKKFVDNLSHGRINSISQIDRVCRVVFPLSFTVFMSFYFWYYNSDPA